MAMKLDEKKGTSQVEVQPKVKTGAPPRVSKPKIKKESGFPLLKVLSVAGAAGVIVLVLALVFTGGNDAPVKQANVQQPVVQEPVAPPASGVSQPPVVQEPVAPPVGNTGINPGIGVVNPPPVIEPNWQPVTAVSFNNYGEFTQQVYTLGILHGSAYKDLETDDGSVLFASDTAFKQWQQFVYQKQGEIHSVEGGSSSNIRASVNPVAWKQLTNSSGVMRVETVWKGFQGPGELSSSAEFTLQKENWELNGLTGTWKIVSVQ